MSGEKSVFIIAVFILWQWMVSAQEGTSPTPEGTPASIDTAPAPGLAVAEATPPAWTATYEADMLRRLKAAPDAASSPDAAPPDAAPGLAVAEAPPPASRATYEADMLRRLKAEIIKELVEGDLLQRSIEKGIERYARKQQEAQRARAEQARLAAEKAKDVRPVSLDRDHIFGDPDAAVSLIEYSDYECGYCKQFHATAKELIQEYDGEVSWVYRHFPLGFHRPAAQIKAEAAECAGDVGGNEIFWKFSDLLYEDGPTGEKEFTSAQLTPFVVELGLDTQAFEDCLASGRFKARVEEDFSEGTKIGITGTPGNILLNNKNGVVEVIHGAQPLSTLKARVEKLLGRHPLKVTGVAIWQGNSLFIDGELGKYQIRGPLLQTLRNNIGRPVSVHGFITGQDQIEATWFSEIRKNTLELFVMSMCPFSINAESAILNFLDTIPQISRPILDIRYIFHEKKIDGKKTLTALHGEKEVQENLVQMGIRDAHPAIFHKYLLMRIDKPETAWQMLAMELGFSAAAIQDVTQMITSQREARMQNEYKYVAEVLGISSSPSFVWESEEVADIRTIEPLKNLAFSATGNCSD